MSKQSQIGVSDVVKIELVSASGAKRTGITGQVLEIHIYEDIESPFMMAQLIMQDAVNLVESFPIIGEEKISLTLKRSGSAEKIYTYEFAVHGINPHTTDGQGKQQMYALLCASEEAIKDSSLLVSKGYKLTYDMMVKNILSEYLGSTKPFISESTKGVQEYVVPSLKPTEAIEAMRMRSVSVVNKSSTFCFFENYNGFNFVTLEGLFRQMPSKMYDYKYHSNPTLNTDMNEQIISFKNTHRANKMDDVTNGALSTKTYSFDIRTKKFEEKEYNYASEGQSFKLSGTSQPYSSNFAAKYGNKPAKNYFIIKDGGGLPTFYEETVGAREAYSTMASAIVVQMLLYGDFELCAGDLIQLKVASMDGLTTIDMEDKVLSGNYVVTKLHHIFINGDRRSHTMSVEIIKGNY